MKRPIMNNSVPGDLVYDPFLGSGTTLIAAELTERAAFSMELMPAYVDMAVIRWQNFTGKAAIHAGTGKTFEDMAVIRNLATDNQSQLARGHGAAIVRSCLEATETGD